MAVPDSYIAIRTKMEEFWTYSFMLSGVFSLLTTVLRLIDNDIIFFKNVQQGVHYLRETLFAMSGKLFSKPHLKQRQAHFTEKVLKQTH